MQIYNNLSLENLPGEEWKTIPNFPNYRASNLGRIKSFKRKAIIIKQSLNEKGYLRISIFGKKGKKCVNAHRAIALAFLDNPNQYKEVNHKNSDKFDNRVENLEWCNRSYNMKHMIESVGVGHRLGMTNPKATIVMHVEYGIFCTMREAAEMSNLKEANFNNMMYEIGYRKNKTKFVFA